MPDNPFEMACEQAKSIGTALLVVSAVIGALFLAKPSSFYRDVVTEIDEMVSISDLISRSEKFVAEEFERQVNISRYALADRKIRGGNEYAILELEVYSDHEFEWSRDPGITAIYGAPIVGRKPIKTVRASLPVQLDNVYRPTLISLPEHPADVNGSGTYTSGRRFFISRDLELDNGPEVRVTYPIIFGPRTIADFQEFWDAMRTGFQVDGFEGPSNFGAARLSMRVIRSDLYFNRTDERGVQRFTEIAKGHFSLSPSPGPLSQEPGNGILLSSSDDVFEHDDPETYQFTIAKGAVDYELLQPREVTVSETTKPISVTDLYPQETQGSFGYYPLYLLELSLPAIPITERFFASVVDGKGLDFSIDFDARFPNVALLQRSLRDLEYPTMKEVALNLQESIGDSSEILGVPVSNEFLRAWGSALIVGLQLYFLSYLNIIRRRLDHLEGSIITAWNLLDGGVLSKSISVALYFFFPTLVSLYANLQFGPIPVIGMIWIVGASALISGYSIWVTRGIWQGSASKT